jgi:hypothetical protein
VEAGEGLITKPLIKAVSKDEQAIKALQYLLDEGFISLGYIDGQPSVFLTTSLADAHKAILGLAKDSADWWK